MNRRRHKTQKTNRNYQGAKISASKKCINVVEILYDDEKGTFEISKNS